jgi:hypothetical protein
MLPQTVTATMSDNTNVMALAKYTVAKLKLYAGYEWMQFAPPSDPFTVAGTGFTTVVGDFVCFECATLLEAQISPVGPLARAPALGRFLHTGGSQVQSLSPTIKTKGFRHRNEGIAAP